MVLLVVNGDVSVLVWYTAVDGFVGCCRNHVCGCYIDTEVIVVDSIVCCYGDHICACYGDSRWICILVVMLIVLWLLL